MAAHAPASRQNTMKGTGLPAIKSGAQPEAGSKAEAEKQFQTEGTAEFEAKMEEIRAADKFAEITDNAPYATLQTPTQIWGIAAAAEKQQLFKRWYFMAKDNFILDTFLTQEEYDAADVEARRALAHKHGTRYAALGPKHSRQPHKDKALRAQFPSMVEQLAQKVR